jgi:polyisoprenoid-binding protein YceI
MQKIFFAIGLCCLSYFSMAQKYTPSETDSKVQFVIKNFGIKVDGQLKGIKGSISFDPSELNNSNFNVSVNANTINTDNTARDKHLKKADYFHVEQFPLISFVSSKITQRATVGQYKVAGNLTIKGTTKPIEFDFTANPTNKGYQFKGAFTINRRDFKVGGNSLPLSDNLTVELDITALKN